MSDEFKALVDVSVDDSEIDKLEQRINEIKNNKIQLDIEVKNSKDAAQQLTSNIEKGLKGAKINTSAISKQLADSFNISDKSIVSKMKKQLDTMATSIAQSWNGTKFDFSKASGFDRSFEALGDMVSKNAKIMESKLGIYQDFYNYFSKKKIFVSDELKSAMGNDLYKEISQANIGKIVRDATKGISLDSLWPEMNDLFPQHFSKEITNQVDQMKVAFDVLKSARQDIAKTLSLDDMSDMQRMNISNEAFSQVADIARAMKTNLEQSIQTATEESKTRFDLDVDINADKVISDIRTVLKTASGSIDDTLDLKLKIDETEITSDLKSAISKISNGDEPVSVDVKINKESLQADINNALENLDLPIHFKIDAAELEADIRKAVDNITDLEINLKVNADQVKESVDGMLPDVADPIEEVRQRVQNNPIRVGYEADTSSIDKLLHTADRAFDFFTGTDIYNFSSDKIRGAITDLKELDTTLTEINKTGNLTNKQLKDLGENSFDQASKWGGLVQDYLSSSETFAQAGFSNLEEMSDLSTMAQMAGQMTAETSSKFIIASDSAWQMKGNVEKLTTMLDGMNMITNRSALNMTDLANGIRVAGSMLANSGLTEDQSAALIGTGVANTKESGETVARGIRTVIMNLRQVQGETEDGEIIDTESLKKVEQTCNDVGVSLKTVKNGIVELRNPIDILRDLSEVYNSLDTMDARRAAITDDIGGKHRSNILASILTNFDDYNKMLQDYSEGAGSAFNEAMKTADSWEGRLNSLSNTWTEFVSGLTNVDAIKGGVSFLDGMISSFDKLNDAQLFIPTMLSSIMGLRNVFQGKGLTNISLSEDETGSLGKLDLKGTLFGIDFSKMGEFKKHMALASEALDAWNVQCEKGFTNTKDFDNEFAKQNKVFRDYITNITDGTANIQDYRKQLEATGEYQQKFSMKSVLANAATGFLIGAGIELSIAAVTKIIDDVIHRQEKIIAAGEEAQSSISNTFSEYSRGKSTITDLGKSFSKSEDEIKTTGDAIDSIAKKYDELSEGVNEFTNQNKTLTTDEYQQYLDVCNQLAEQFPSLVSGYDDQGNAILSLGSSADSAAESIRKLYEAQQLSANVEIGNNLQTAYDGITTQISQYEKQIEAFESSNEHIADKINDINDEQQQIQDGLFKNGTPLFEIKNLDDKKERIVRDLLSQYGIDDMYNVGVSENGLDFSFVSSGLEELTEEQIASLNEQYTNAIETSINTTVDKLSAENNQNDKNISSNEMMIKDQWKALSTSLGQYLQTADSFTGLDTEIQNALINNLGNVDLSAISEKYDGQVLPFLYGEFIQPISELKPEAQKAFGELLNLDKSGMTLQEYQKQWSETLQSLFPDDSMAQTEWSKKLGFSEIFGEELDKTQKLRDRFKDNVQDIENMTLGDRDLAYDIIANDNFSGTFSHLLKLIEQSKEAAEEKFNINATPMLDEYKKAKETENKGDRYLEMMSAFEEAQKAYENGLVGTDDFKTAAALLSPNAMEDSENWVENYGKVLRYFTEDSSGVKNFLDDLSTKTNEAGEALASYNEETGQWAYNIDDMEAAADAMGISFEAFTAIMGRLEDYGFSNDFFGSITEGTDHLTELYGELSTAETKLQELKDAQAAGDTTVTDTVIDAQQAKVDQIRQSIETTQDYLDQLLERTAADYEAEAESGLQVAQKLVEQLGSTDNSSVKGMITDDLGELVSEYHLQLVYDTEGNIIDVVSKDVDEAQSEADRNPVEIKYTTPVDLVNSARKDAEWKASTERQVNADTLVGIGIEAKNPEKVIQDVQSEADSNPVEIETTLKSIDLLENQLGQKDQTIQSDASSGEGIQITTVAKDPQKPIEEVQAAADANPVEIHVTSQAETPTITDTNLAAANLPISIDESSIQEEVSNIHFDAVKVPVSADGTSIQEEFNNDTASSLPTVSVPFIADSSEFDSTSSKVQGEIGSLNAMAASPTIDATNFASSQISSVSSELDSLNGKRATTIIETVRINRTENAGGKAVMVQGTAHAQGTVSSNSWDNYFQAIGAYASGTLQDWALHEDETALCNEEGTEGLVRGGKFMLIPGGAHLEQFKKGDIIFSADQTKELLKYGKVISGGGHGKRAFADGTTNNIINAYAGGGGGGGTFVGGASSPSNNSATNKNTTALNNNTSAQKKATTANTKNLDGFKEWLEKLKDWVEVRLSRLQESIDLSTAKSENHTGYVKKNEKLTDAQKTTTLLIQANKDGQKKYEQQATKVKNKAVSSGLLTSKKADSIVTKIKNGTIDIAEYDENVREFIQAYEEWFTKAQDCKQAVEELKQSQRELAQQKFDNITEQYDNMLDHIEHQANMINEYIDQAEAKGYVQSAKYYNTLIGNEMHSIEHMQAERKALVASLQEALNSGYITMASNEWYEMQIQINEVTEAIQEANGNIIEFQNQIRQISWDKFDQGQEAIKRIIDESDFLIDLMSNNELFDDKGEVTNEGLATFGLHGINYNTHMTQAQKYKDEMQKINADLANDPNNLTLLKRREELLDLQRESIEAAEDEKQSIKSLVQEGIEKELDALDDLIEKYTDALDSQKDLYDYQKNIADQTSEISRLQKQLAAYSMNDSEEGRAKTQEIRNSLKEAQENLKETEYDKYVSDQKELLDNLKTEYEDVLNRRLDNLDQLVSDVVSAVNANSGLIGDTLREEASNVGYTLTTSMETIWGTNGTVTSVISTFSQNFTNATTTLQGSIDAILTGVNNLYNQADSKANTDINIATTSNNDNPQNVAPTPSSSGSSGGGTTPTIPVSQPQKKADTNKANLDKIKKIINSFPKGNAGNLSNYSDLFRYIYGKSGRLITDAGLKQIAQILGVSTSGWNRTKKSTVLKKLKAAGYEKGTKQAKEEFAWTHEGETVIRKSDGAVLTPVDHGAVFNKEATDFLYNFANNPKPLLDDTFRKTFNNNLPMKSSGSTVTNEFQVTFSFPHVLNYEDFARQAQHDSRFTGVTAKTIDTYLSGKNSLNKFDIKF